MKILGKTVLLITTVLAGDVAAAQTLYVAKVHVLQTDGKFVSYPLKGTENGVSKIECEMRKDAWLEKFKATFESAKKTAEAEGESADMRVTCDLLGGK